MAFLEKQADHVMADGVAPFPSWLLDAKFVEWLLVGLPPSEEKEKLRALTFGVRYGWRNVKWSS